MSSEKDEIQENLPLASPTIYEIISQEAQQELVRPVQSLVFSGIAAGLCISFSLFVMGYLSLMSNNPLIVAMGYTVGFLIVINRDEQCQGYALGVKRLGYDDPCEKDDEERSESALNVLSEYVVYFDFDSADIRSDDQKTLRRAANEISKYNPRQVRVARYTDTRGSMAYNAALSAERADEVSDFLTGLGVSNFVVDEEALGETNLAVPTADEVKSQANRRVVIQFVQ